MHHHVAVPAGLARPAGHVGVTQGGLNRTAARVVEPGDGGSKGARAVESTSSPTGLLLVGLFNLACGAWLLMRARRFRARAVRVPGVVTGLERSRDPDSNARFPVFRFTTAEGEELEVTSRHGESRPPQPGERVTVLYDPARERDARIDTGGQDGSTMGRWVVGIGGFLVTLGVLASFGVI